jgi:hypothetical protein
MNKNNSNKEFNFYLEKPIKIKNKKNNMVITEDVPKPDITIENDILDNMSIKNKLLNIKYEVNLISKTIDKLIKEIDKKNK